MPKIHDFDLPEELRAEVEALALNIDAKEAVEIARSLPKQFKGFEISKKKADLLKSRLSQCIWTIKELDPALRLALAGAGLGRPLVAVLSAEALSHGLDGWLGCFGREGLLLGMLLDGREEIREIAQGVLDGSLPTTPLSGDDALRELADGFGPFLARVAHFLPGRPVPAGPDPGLQQKCEDLQSALAAAERRVRTLEKSLTERSEQLKQQKGDVERQKGLLKEARAAESAAVKRAGELTAELARHEAGRAAAIAAGVEATLSERRNSWLAGPERVGRVLGRAERDAAGLLALAHEALRQQQDYDRHSGNRALLEEQLVKLEGSLGRLREARVNAIRLHPALEEAVTALEGKIDEVSRALGREVVGDPAHGVLAAKINAAADIDVVAALLHLAAEMHGCGLLTANAYDVIRAAAERKLWLLLALPGKTGPAVRDLGCLSGASAGQPCRVVIDGHNLLFSYPFFRHYFEGSNPGRKAREILAVAVNRLAQCHPGLCVDLFFDSREINDENFSERVRLVFSGGNQAEHRADDAIIAHLEHLRRNEKKVCRLLVTSDRELAEVASEGGTKVINIEQFAVLLPLGQV